jgi:hypothetical protein
MAESWLEILERASANLSIELTRRIPDRVQPRQTVQRSQPRGPARARSVPTAKADEARALLERELEALEAGTALSRRDGKPASVIVRQVKDQPRVLSHEDGGPASSVVAPREQKVERPASILTAIYEALPDTPSVEVTPTPQLRTMKLSKRRLWYGAIVVSLSAIVIGLAAHLLLGHTARDADADATKQVTRPSLLEGDPINIPLPARRPAAWPPR